MPSPTFPNINPKTNLTVKTVLPSQIYTIDDFFTASEVKAVRSWMDGVVMEGPKPPGKGEAERTARRGSLNSPEIAQILLNLISPYIPLLSPRYTSSPPALSPNIRIYHYPSGTYFRTHYDSPTLDPISRRLSCWTILIYISECKGGATAFYTHTHDTGSSKKTKSKNQSKQKGEGEKVSVDPKAGRLLLHWHGMSGGGCLKHEGEEVKGGDKWVLRTDILA
ncbi:hypothetical protein I302_109114 [Kwoniella bestiolae CBS 10118]|uniref:Fe2OG dioxygenase domain-containing protein n=1 Tax=Kwoniella bestiolae CBS 10118 TaxID=1296100 RepID=A0A1B9FV24_9TREE|nr:hypothetical protein I302_08259 [Kwoniella bestiolae CBS 10118]OCF22608.1 hypothetical protein I302_08259 [Kwoniella bestiolae CBS 10118]